MTRQSQDVEFLIVTPTYHRESLLVRFLKQVKSQTYGCWRLLGMCRKQLPCFPEICYQALRSEPNREEGSMDAYAPEIERKMKRLFDSLSEDDRRRYAAVEATKLGHGGIEYIAQLLQCDPKTIRRGLAELDEAADLDTSRVRKRGWTQKVNRGLRRPRRELLEGP